MTTPLHGRPPSRSTRPPPDADMMRIAFRELHAARLYGFALLLTLGDRAQAASLAATALAIGERRWEELRHPERAAAWLRAEVVREYRPPRGRPPLVQGDRRAALELLGVSRPAAEALGALPPRERAGLIADRIEGLAPLDIATVVGRHGGRLARLLNDARRRYSAAYAPASGDSHDADGPLARRIRDIATRAVS